MDNRKYKEAVKELVADRYKGRKRISSKYKPIFPSTAEREFARVTNAYMKILDQSIRESLPEIMKAYKKAMNGDSREDGIFDWLSPVLEKMNVNMEKRLAAFNMKNMIYGVGDIVKNASFREWKRSVKRTLNLDLLNKYYNDDYYAELIKTWTDTNVLKITSLSGQCLTDMQNIIYDGFRSGKTTEQIAKEIQEKYKVSKSKARALARDQVGTLNSQITRLQQTDAGCTHYKWSTCHDSVVRDCHRQLDGKIFSWYDPPRMWYRKNGGAIVYSGRRCHPGEDYGCRCIAVPVFDYEELDIPVSDVEKKDSERRLY